MGRIKCGNAMDIKSGPPLVLPPQCFLGEGRGRGFRAKSGRSLILIRTANHLLFFAAGRLVILKSAEGGEASTRWTPAITFPPVGWNKILEGSFFFTHLGLNQEESPKSSLSRDHRPFMFDNIPVERQFYV